MPANSQEISLSALRRSAAELLACSVMRLYPNTMLVSGESTDLGFFYDFVFEHAFSDADLIMVEEHMRALVRDNTPVRSTEMMRENAANLFTHHGQEIQASVVLDVQENIVSVFQINDFYDYCPLPHVANTSEVASFKLLKFTEWDYLLTEDEDISITRITGTAFPDAASLKQHLKRLDTAKKRDHQMLGMQMDLFSHTLESDYLWHPKGTCLRNLLIDLWKNIAAAHQFQPISTPIPLLPGHDSQIICSLQHALIYAARERNEEDLPIRFSEWDQWFNDDNEDDDALFEPMTCSGDFESVFCKTENLASELKSSLQFIQEIVRILGFECRWVLVHCRKEFQPFSEEEKVALEAMKKALKQAGLDFTQDDREGDFAEVSAEALITDILGREWRGPWVSVDFGTLDDLELRYRTSSGSYADPAMVTMSAVGMLERLIALMIERDGGVLPLWLVPEQVRVIAIGKLQAPYAEEVRQKVAQAGFRVGIDLSNEKLGAKIHRAEEEKIPFMLIIGEKEQSKQEIAVRDSRHEQPSKTMSLEAFLEEARRIAHEEERRRLES